MTPTNRTSFYSQFVFSLTPFLDYLWPEAENIALEVTQRRATEISAAQVVAAWVVYQIERHLFLSLEMNEVVIESLQLAPEIPRSFLDNQRLSRDMLLSQVEPVLTRGDTIPYIERMCRVTIRLPDLILRFL